MSQERFTAIEEPHPDHALIFRRIPAHVLVVGATPDFPVVDATDAYFGSIPIAREAAVGRPLFEVFPDAAEGLLRSSLERVLAGGEADGLNAPAFGLDGAMRYIIHTVEDYVPAAVRERDEAVRALRSANEELEAFAYSASQDVQAPLRAIAGFSSLLQEMHRDVLDAEARRCLDKIGTNVQRMAQIIDDVLALSRIGRCEMRREPVDVSALARRVALELRSREPGRSVQVVVAEGMRAHADERLLGIVLANLMSNAWKYTAHKDHACIEVGALGEGEDVVFYVKDNGAGFDMGRAERLFRPFVRLHREPRFEGNGIGLATVKRVVDRHGGRIWAQAAPDRGATFHFTLEATETAGA